VISLRWSALINRRAVTKVITSTSMGMAENATWPPQEIKKERRKVKIF